jgi:hypothetical protein
LRATGTCGSKNSCASVDILPCDAAGGSLSSLEGCRARLGQLLERKLPFIVRRKMPDGQSEYWGIHELELAW